MSDPSFGLLDSCRSWLTAGAKLPASELIDLKIGPSRPNWDYWLSGLIHSPVAWVTLSDLPLSWLPMIYVQRSPLPAGSRCSEGIHSSCQSGRYSHYLWDASIFSFGRFSGIFMVTDSF